MLELIDQSEPEGFDPTQVLILTFRCASCGERVRAHSLNKAEILHRRCDPIVLERIRAERLRAERKTVAEEVAPKRKRGRPKKIAATLTEGTK